MSWNPGPANEDTGDAIKFEDSLAVPRVAGKFQVERSVSRRR